MSPLLEIQSVMMVFSTPFVNQRSSYRLTECVTGGGGEGIGLCGEHIQELYITYVFDQISNLQNCFTTQAKT